MYTSIAQDTSDSFGSFLGTVAWRPPGPLPVGLQLVEAALDEVMLGDPLAVGIRQPKTPKDVGPLVFVDQSVQAISQFDRNPDHSPSLSRHRSQHPVRPESRRIAGRYWRCVMSGRRMFA